MALPPGFELEQPQQTARIRLPPGFQLESASPPPGMRAVRPGEIPTESGFYPVPPEEPRRTFGQRVLGAAAAPLDVAATLVSGAGRAAATLP